MSSVAPSARGLYGTLLGTVALGAVLVAARPGERDTLRALLRPRTAPAPVTAALPGARPVAVTEPPLPPRWVPRVRARAEPIPFLDDPCFDAACTTRALDAFAARVNRARGVTRVLHLGDSLIADDRITGRLRRRLQRELGDGGLGFVFLRPTARSYHPAGVRFDARGWYPGSVVGPRWPDARYGLGGTGFEALDSGPHATLTFDRGRSFTVLVEPSPTNGSLSLRLDDAPAQTARATTTLQAASDGPHTVTVRATGGKVRVFGVVATRDGPGITVENLGTVSNSARALLHQSAESWRDALREADPALVVLSLGTNEASHGALSPDDRAALEVDAVALYRRVREALPRASCLVTAPLDTATVVDGAARTRPALPHILRAQAAAARAAGCAFFDAHAWMGGRGSITRWRDQGLADGDLTHLTDAGGARLGDALADTLLRVRDSHASEASP
jgi:lysophospholipase L1-like esterase